MTWTSVKSTRWMRHLAIGVTAAALAAGSGCGDNPTGPQGLPTTAPYLTGRVTSVTPTSDRSVSIRVEANPQDPTSAAKAIARVDDFAFVTLPGGGETDYRALAAGQWVRLWYEGAVQDSDPVQGIARAVAIDSLARNL